MFVLFAHDFKFRVNFGFIFFRFKKCQRAENGALCKNGGALLLAYMGMELKDLSSNWRKLQESLKSNSKGPSPAAKRKRSDHGAPSKALKRPKTSAYAEKRSDERQKILLKRKKTTMSAQDAVDETHNKATQNGTAPNGSAASTTDRLGWEGKVNEGLSTT
jgi:hypothetical protein